MTGKDAFEMITKGGATDFVSVIEICTKTGDYCMIGGLAVNCYVDPVYTLDADLVVSASNLDTIQKQISAAGFDLKDYPNSLNAQMSGSTLRIQFTKDPRYQDFVTRSVIKEIFGVPVRVATLPDLVQGKIWAWEDPNRRLSKRQKDQADLIRIAEEHPEMQKLLPASLQQLIANS